MKFLCVLCIVLYVGCGKKDGTSPAAVSSPAAQPTPASPAVVPPASGSVLAKTDDETGKMRAEVTELKKSSGGILTLRVAFVNTSNSEISPGTSQFSDLSQSGGDVGGIHLIDPVNKKKYFALRDTEKKCVCSGWLPRLAPGERVMSWVRFPAPPEEVGTISVMIPSFPPRDEVAIAR